MSCSGPFKRFTIESETDMKKTLIVPGGSRDRLRQTTGSLGSFTASSSGNKISGANDSSTIDTKIDWLVKTVKKNKK